ncbi:uncharacterized protein METZ01_LOCUS356078, partial [marine metagenome]
MTDGTTYTINVAVSDVAGNSATDTGDTFVYDKTAPTSTTAVLAVGGDGNGNNGDAVTMTLDPSETVATPTCTFTSDGDAMAGTVTYSTSNPDSHIASITVANGDSDGTVAFSCTYSDLAGNAIGTAITSASSGSVTIDNTHPSISSVAASWGAYLNAAEDNSDGTITVITSGAADGQTVTITGMGVTDTCSVSSNTCTATIAAADLQGLTDGTTYTITVNVDDAAGNSATPDTGDTFIYDKTNPSISNVVADWGAYLNAVEDNSDGTITVTTVGVADGLTVTVTGMGVTDTCSVSTNSCTATIAAADLQGLTDGTT